jgi:hypothetical protein
MPSVIVKTNTGKRLAGVSVELTSLLFGVPQKITITSNHIGEATVTDPGLLYGGSGSRIYAEAEYDGKTWVYNGTWAINAFGNYIPRTLGIELSPDAEPRQKPRTDVWAMYETTIKAILIIALVILIMKYIDFSSSKRYRL